MSYITVAANRTNVDVLICPQGDPGTDGVNGEVGQQGFYGEAGDPGKQGSRGKDNELKHGSRNTEYSSALFPVLFP